MSVWSWDLPFEELALPPHGYHMAAIWLPQRSYSDYCSVTVSLNHCGYVGIYSAQATSQVYKAGGFHLYPPALVSQVVLWLHLPHWLPTFLIVFYLLLTVSDILLTIILLLLTVTLLLPHYLLCWIPFEGGDNTAAYYLLSDWVPPKIVNWTSVPTRTSSRSWTRPVTEDSNSLRP